MRPQYKNIMRIGNVAKGMRQKIDDFMRLSSTI
jgi:hypothetical protein